MTDEAAADAPYPGEPVIVAMGASAGGLRALQSFFSSIPGDTGAAFVVIVHLDPERRSELATLLGGRTAMPVIQVQDREKIVANRVYVIPPDRRLELIDHEIEATPFLEPRWLRLAESYRFVEQMERFLDDANRRAQGRRPAVPTLKNNNSPINRRRRLLLPKAIAEANSLPSEAARGLACDFKIRAKIHRKKAALGLASARL